ncbi:Do family serine endopeptidase [Devosia sp. ZB163]|uniref:Do family serine endopeptidase n=1 Tax=Devosia sp. ZB163 TaxID=3025938 RepID=UPI002362FE52|nr:Do family serine endopeptidase [Devosia sp. ZB163]MDC9823849.1 Do family serine endopeptidase [Devosia sp. ZB163]
MRSTLNSRARRWIGASALAILAGIGGGTAFVAATAPSTAQSAKLVPAAQITAPAVTNVPNFADLVEAVKPAVVSIVVEGSEKGRDLQRGGRQFEFRFPDLPNDHPFRDFFEQFGEQFGAPGRDNNNNARPQPPRRTMAAGSGFVISADGYIVTNNHVVDDAEKVTVIFEDGTEKQAKLVGTDEKTDLAVVKLEGETDLPFVKLSDIEPRVGEWVVAVGNPFGLGGTVTAGIISARGRDIAGSAYGDFLQIDAAVNTGNSGGPDFNMQGEVVGVNTAIFSPNGGNVGIAFAIPASVVKQVTNQLIEHGAVTRGFLGVGIQDVNRDIAESVGLATAAGALVTEPSKDSPADKAGVKSGDVITAVDGDQVTDALDLSRTIAGKNPGSTVELTIWRDGKEQKISVTLGKLDEAAQAPSDEQTQQQPPAAPEPASTSVGLTLVPNSGGEGLLIQDVDPSSAAAERGFAVGDTILEVNNQAVKSVDEFEKAIQSVKDNGRNTALVKAQRDGNTRFVGLPITEDKS